MKAQYLGHDVWSFPNDNKVTPSKGIRTFDKVRDKNRHFHLDFVLH